ncbi:50S ribosomal protein L7/L12-serine acetyltransferase [Enterobacteriaceae bacterium 4M9]|nr:50S ribosomal protein L7/L12-serine acetyltransferase [Enterobacteriaceae bacterium 4M9]
MAYGYAEKTLQPKHNWQDETIEADAHLSLHSVSERFLQPLFALIQRNKVWLQQAMDWPQYVNKPEDTLKTLRANYLLHHRGFSKMFMLVLDGELVGVFSFNQMEAANRAAYIGYWIDEGAQGRGIIARALEAVIAKYAREGSVRRFVIRCIVTNEASNRVALRNGFTLEGCLRQAEYLNGAFHDQNIYARIVESAQTMP